LRQKNGCFFIVFLILISAPIFEIRKKTSFFRGVKEKYANLQAKPGRNTLFLSPPEKSVSGPLGQGIKNTSFS
jgi:hypothetical protein